MCILDSELTSYLFNIINRAQAEIDSAIGEDRSPTWDDFDTLPYINMMIKESHRWRPVSPLGVSHAVAEGKCSFLVSLIYLDLATVPPSLPDC